MTKKLTLQSYDDAKPNLYCGKSNDLPDEYDDFGSSYDCLRKGFGAGKASASPKRSPKILSISELKSIAKALSISLSTKRGAKSPKTLIREIIKAMNSL